MNLKASVIALTLTGTLIVPVAVQAEDGEGIGAYASIRPRVAFVDNGTTDVSGFSNGFSRFGLKASRDLGNGMTAFGRWEWGNGLGQNNNPGVRLAYAGVSGDFGSISGGSQWGPWHTFVAGGLPTFLGNIDNIGPAFGRIEDSIQYQKSFGSVTLGVNLTVDAAAPKDDIDSSMFALKFNAGPAKLALVTFQDADNYNSRQHTATPTGNFGVGGSGTGFRADFEAGNALFRAILTQYDKKYYGQEATGLRLIGKFGVTPKDQIIIGYAQLDQDTTNNTKTEYFGEYKRTLGKSSSFLIDFDIRDPDVVGQKETTTITTALKFDWN